MLDTIGNHTRNLVKSCLSSGWHGSGWRWSRGQDLDWWIHFEQLDGGEGPVGPNLMGDWNSEKTSSQIVSFLPCSSGYWRWSLQKVYDYASFVENTISFRHSAKYDTCARLWFDKAFCQVCQPVICFLIFCNKLSVNRRTLLIVQVVVKFATISHRYIGLRPHLTWGWAKWLFGRGLQGKLGIIFLYPRLVFWVEFVNWQGNNV